jgi:hypothetical protein
MDVRLHDQGSLIGFQPVTDSAYEFMYDQVESAGWQWLGAVLWVDQRLARDLMQGMIDHGLELGT